MLNPNCLTRPNEITSAPRKSESEYTISRNAEGWEIQHQNWDVCWIIQLTDHAYQAYQYGDNVFDEYWGTPNTFWDTEVTILFKEYYEDD